ncbi:MAG TPA: hypothetical protein ENI86_01630 [Acidimicrobiales bacterium]|nr:hypothetical protein [Acidimicrobiales bacterium]
MTGGDADPGGNGVLPPEGTGLSPGPGPARDRLEYLPVILALVLMAVLAVLIFPLDTRGQSGSDSSANSSATTRTGEESGPLLDGPSAGVGAVVAVASILLVPVVLAGFPLAAGRNRRKAWLVSAALLTLFAVIFLFAAVGLFVLPAAAAAWFVWRRSPPDP